MKWCVLITTYNRCQLLKRAIDSAIAQTLPCEIIVIDDASTDETEHYLRNLEYPIKFARNQVNCGHSVSVNRGINLTDADWIKMLDDDDYLAPNCLEIMNQAILNYSKAVICSVKAIQVNEKGRNCGQTPSIGTEIITYIHQTQIHYKMLIERLPFGTPVQVGFRKDAFVRSGGWNSHLDLHYDDIDSWVRIAQFGDAIFINQCLAYRYVWSGGYNQKFPIQKRLEMNLLIKEQIYFLVHENYRQKLPSQLEIQEYLKLYWGLIALKQLEFDTCFQLIFPSILSFKAWLLLLNAIVIPKTSNFSLV